MSPKTILLADDHAIFIEGLKSLLLKEEAYKVVMSVGNGKEVLEFLENFRVDLLILDLNMPVIDGLETLSRIKQQDINLKILVLSAYEDPKLIKKIKQGGAHGIVNKAHTEEQLISALNVIVNGGNFFPEDFFSSENTIADAYIKKFRLTPREIEVLQLVAKEMTSKEIADKLFISEETAKTHRKNLVRKLQVKGVAGLVKFAIEMRLV